MKAKKRAGDVDQVVEYLSIKLKTEFKSQYCPLPKKQYGSNADERKTEH
jgi:hypothetical protein